MLLGTQRKNAIRQQPFATLVAEPKLRIHRERFRDLAIFIAVLTTRVNQNVLAVAVRAHVSPYNSTRTTYFGGFLKCEDESWSDLTASDQSFDSLRLEMDREAPLL